MEGWQSKAAFVVQFRENTDIEAGRLEGKVEHIASYQATRFHSVDELLAFIARVLTEIRNERTGAVAAGPAHGRNLAANDVGVGNQSNPAPRPSMPVARHGHEEEFVKLEKNRG